MKTQLTKEESAHLINLGVPKEKASDKISYGFLGYDPIFTLTDLFSILPKEIKIENKEYSLIIEFNSLYAFAFYYRGNTPSLGKKRKEELIDALYELCVWCLENNYLKY